ncbi:MULTISPECIES: VanZ family protein [unclassified Rathayibacter]|uniref:VanZ family protein n=1 Tax=unclassified Rathayibacter TaxID=2609250 RepID=UPI00188A3B35|nr:MULTISPECIES: VanZ family protein [unclassified Rathayibacter]MBF4462872.1 VanZ family protein [Rathayibacter sp. VKM Ac-2879]MBF4504286.1 VanZ family protein [Rathayibacter sp. VKM Ac-2878]
MTRPLARLTLVVGVPYLLALTLVALWQTPIDRPIDGALERGLRWLAEHGLGAVTYDTVEAWANIALFVPFGALAALNLRARWAWVAVLLGAATSALIETAQLLLLPARFASTHDVVMNTIGAAIGAGLGASLRAWLLGRERRRALEEDLAYAHIPLHGASGVPIDQQRAGG